MCTHTLCPLVTETSAKIVAGSYQYTTDLQELETASQRPDNTCVTRVFPFSRSQDTQEPYPASLPDKHFAVYLRRDSQNGFQIGADTKCPLQAVESNMPSSTTNATLVNK